MLSSGDSDTVHVDSKIKNRPFCGSGEKDRESVGVRETEKISIKGIF